MQSAGALRSAAVHAQPRAGQARRGEDAIRQSIQEYLARQIFSCALVLLLCDLQRETAAQAALDQLAFADISFDNDWLLSMSFLADAIEHLADAARAATLYDLVLPYAALNGSNADEISVGSMARSLGTPRTRWGAGTRARRTSRRPGDAERAELLASTPAL